MYRPRPDRAADRGRPLDIPHLGAEKSRIVCLVPHRRGVISAIFQDPVGRLDGLRSQCTKVQYLCGFPRFRKFT